MADLLKQGSDWLQDQLKQHAAQTVTYKRGTDSVQVEAVPTGFNTQVAETEEILVDERARDFLIQAADLVLGGTTVEPVRGDIIAWGSDTYEVLPPRDVPAWENSDPYGKTLRIHTKLVDTG